MRRAITEVVTPQVASAARHLAALVKQARLARRWTQASVAERAKVSKPTFVRLERGGPEVSLGAWLSVLEVLGLLGAIEEIRDPASEARLKQSQSMRARARTPGDLDF